LGVLKMMVMAVNKARKALALAVLVVSPPLGIWAGYNASSVCFASSLILGGICASAFFRYGCKILVEPVFLAIGAIAGACGMYHTLYKVATPPTELAQGRYAVAVRLTNLRPHCPQSNELNLLAATGQRVCLTQDLGDQSIAINEIIKAQAYGPLLSFADSLMGLPGGKSPDACAEIAVKVEQSCPVAFQGLDPAHMEAVRKAAWLSSSTSN